MRKIKNKDTKLKDKQIIKIFNENAPYYLIVRAMLELPLAIRMVFNISRQEQLDYAKKGVKITYKSELLKDEWYKGITACMNRWLKFSERVKVIKADLDLAMTKYVEDRYVQAMVLQCAAIQSKFIKEKMNKIDDNPMAQAVTLVANLYTIDMLLNEKSLSDKIKSNDLKYMRWLCSTYRNTLGAILYDIDSYKGYYTLNKQKGA